LKFAPQATAIARTAAEVFKAPKLLTSEREAKGMLFNIHFLTTNGLSMNKGAPLHGLIDFHFSFQEDIPIEIDLDERPTVGDSQTKLSKIHRSSYSTWELFMPLVLSLRQKMWVIYRRPGIFHC